MINFCVHDYKHMLAYTNKNFGTECLAQMRLGKLSLIGLAGISTSAYGMWLVLKKYESA